MWSDLLSLDSLEQLSLSQNRLKVREHFKRGEEHESEILCIVSQIHGVCVELDEARGVAVVVVVVLGRPSLASCFSSEVLTEWETRRPIGRLARLHLLPPIPPSSSSDVSKKRKKRSEERLDGVTREYRQTLRIYTALLQGTNTLCICMHVQISWFSEKIWRSILLGVCVCAYSYSCWDHWSEDTSACARIQD